MNGKEEERNKNDNGKHITSTPITKEELDEN